MSVAPFMNPESYAQMVEQVRGAPPPQHSDKGLMVQFFPHPVLNDAKSFGGRIVLTLPGKDDAARRKKAEQVVRDWDCGARLVGVGAKAPGRGFDDYEVEIEGAGRPIFDQMDYIFIAAPGDKTSIARRPAWKDPRAPNSDINRFPEKWKLYKAGAGQQQLVGTRLEFWPVLHSAQVAELKALNIFTVEQLAELNDEVTGRFHGLLTLKQRAQATIDGAKGGAAVQQLASEKRQLEDQVSAMRRQLEEMAKSMEELKRGIKK